MHWRILFVKGFYLFPEAGILGEFSGENLSRIFVSFPSVSFQGSGLFRWVGARVEGHWSLHLG